MLVNKFQICPCLFTFSSMKMPLTIVGMRYKSNVVADPHLFVGCIILSVDDILPLTYPLGGATNVHKAFTHTDKTSADTSSMTCHCRRWVAGDWSRCSVTCGGGRQRRNVHCWRMLAAGLDSTVRPAKCAASAAPPGDQRCQLTDCGAEWKATQWSEVRRDDRCSYRNADVSTKAIVVMCHPSLCVTD